MNATTKGLSMATPAVAIRSRVARIVTLHGICMALLMAGAATAEAQSPEQCPHDGDVVIAFERDGEVRGYMGIDVDTDTATYCDDRRISWAANYVRTADGFDFDMLARNGIWRRTMRPDNGQLADSWARDGSQFRTIVIVGAP